MGIKLPGNEPLQQVRGDRGPPAAPWELAQAQHLNPLVSQVY